MFSFWCKDKIRRDVYRPPARAVAIMATYHDDVSDDGTASDDFYLFQVTCSFHKLE